MCCPRRGGESLHTRQGIVAAFLSTQDNPKPDVTTPPSGTEKGERTVEGGVLTAAGRPLSLSLSSRTLWVKGGTKERVGERERERERGVTGEEE